jgi:glycerophosphoryl diester phosphodiesterase
VPEFKEVLALCKGKINIYLDFKEADVAETWREIKAAGMEKHVVVYLNKEAQYQQWKDTRTGSSINDQPAQRSDNQRTTG